MPRSRLFGGGGCRAAPRFLSGKGDAVFSPQTGEFVLSEITTKDHHATSEPVSAQPTTKDSQTGKPTPQDHHATGKPGTGAGEPKPQDHHATGGDAR